MEQGSERKAITEILNKKIALSRADLQVLRENSAAANLMSSRSDWFLFRIEVELIDSITALNQSSSKLARVGIAVAIVGVVLALAAFSLGLVSLSRL